MRRSKEEIEQLKLGNPKFREIPVDELVMKIGEVELRARMEIGLTAREAADLIGIHFTTLYGIEKGETTTNTIVARIIKWLYTPKYSQKVLSIKYPSFVGGEREFIKCAKEREIRKKRRSAEKTTSRSTVGRVDGTGTSTKHRNTAQTVKDS